MNKQNKTNKSFPRHAEIRFIDSHPISLMIRKKGMIMTYLISDQRAQLGCLGARLCEVTMQESLQYRDYLGRAGKTAGLDRGNWGYHTTSIKAAGNCTQSLEVWTASQSGSQWGNGVRLLYSAVSRSWTLAAQPGHNLGKVTFFSGRHLRDGTRATVFCPQDSPPLEEGVHHSWRES